MTTLGHPEDFEVPALRTLVMNAIHWALGVSPRMEAAEPPGGSDARANPSPSVKEPWIPLTPIEQMAQTDYDVLIVGSAAVATIPNYQIDNLLAVIEAVAGKAAAGRTTRSMP